MARAAHGDAGVLLITGNYAGDVMNFGLAVQQLQGEGIDARYLAVTDDIASASPEEVAKRRGIAGDFTVFRCASAVAEDGADLDTVERVAAKANEVTRTLGVAFDGCTMPGADRQLFTVAHGTMDLGLGIHGEPGVSSHEMPTAAELAELLVSGVLAEKPSGSSDRVAVILNGLGRTKYEELFVVWKTASALLTESGHTVVQPEVGELVTSLDMAGCSLTVMWLDDELERLWTSPADTPAYRKGQVSSQRKGVARRAGCRQRGRRVGGRCRRSVTRHRFGCCPGNFGDRRQDGRGRDGTGTHRRRRRRWRPRPRHGEGHDGGFRAARRLARAAVPPRC